ncbi:DNA repair protein RecN [Stagnimonas aquatica]|uniref:DNA repair protein RecN n=1 Tax=Stagnimonas aquatica TaxID=2689987 RepID=A0A3N0VDW1_9GAMM|nr:DNA repair protein RecN [Stagnimonas aquatica]ROH90967.1 DNA repair protein RecN [Stagnimonas aquatica]
MLRQLQIRNLAIIDEAQLDFAAGFTVLTGETGAGKSILLDALGLVLGTRADPALVRQGSDKAEISAEFDLSDSTAARDWLAEHELLDADDGQLCLIRRVVHAEGRTRAFVNGQAVNAGPLRELGEQLVELFGQNESQTLLKPEVQRGLLDDYGDHGTELAAVRAAAGAVQQGEQAIAAARAAASRDPAQLDYLRHQVQELEALNLREGELEELEAEHRRLANAGRLIEDGNRAQELLYGGEAAIYDQLSSASDLLAGLAGLEPGFAEAENLAAAAQAQVREAADQIQRLLDRLELDPEALERCERRLSALHDLARKHRIRLSELPAHQAGLRAELDALEHAAGGLDALLATQAGLIARYRAAATQLSAARRKAAGAFGAAVTAVVRQLGMANARFEVAVDAAAGERVRSHGDDEVRFDFSANAGQAPRPLSKVASGGELSRVSLAIQVCSQTARGGGVATMIFDEVDAGIGGGVAEVVGQKLRELGGQRQVLCVTHLAQVAAQGRQHLGIRKEVSDGQTYTRVRPLEKDARTLELARMLGGQDITAATQALARDLLKRAG